MAKSGEDGLSRESARCVSQLFKGLAGSHPSISLEQLEWLLVSNAPDIDLKPVRGWFEQCANGDTGLGPAQFEEWMQLLLPLDHLTQEEFQQGCEQLADLTPTVSATQSEMLWRVHYSQQATLVLLALHEALEDRHSSAMAAFNAMR